MTASWKFAVRGIGAALALCASVLAANAQRIVPAGYDTYYFSGTTADPLNASNPNDRGNTVQQADNILNKLQGMLQKSGLGVGLCSLLATEYSWVALETMTSAQVPSGAAWHTIRAR